MLYRIIYLNKKHCFTIQKKRSKLLHHNKLIISHIKQTNIRYSAAHLRFMSWALPDKNYVFIIFQISAHCIYWEERLALEYFPTLLRVKIDFFLCSCYRHLPDVDETACSTICLPEENCVAVQYTPRMLGIHLWKGCKLFGIKGKIQVIYDNATLAKTVVFLARLQSEKKLFCITSKSKQITLLWIQGL